METSRHDETEPLQSRGPGQSGEPHIHFRASDADQGAASPSTSPQAKAEQYYPKIEGYRITGVLGEGGMGAVVYRAVQTRLNRAVALKVLPAMTGKASPKAVARFRREATAAGQLHHTNIVPIHDFGESHEAYYYAMELIEGQPLSALVPAFGAARICGASAARVDEIIRTATSGTAPEVRASSSSGARLDVAVGASSTGRGRPYYQQVARWMADAADALQYAHSQGVIHRDIKPANLILSVDGRIMIADFGLAKSEDEQMSLTITGALLGTVRYMSPEQAMASRIPIDHRTDIYSLGATMYELLCFQPAYPGTDDKQVLAAVIQRDPIPPQRVQRLVPKDLQTICMAMLEKRPDSRYPTARAVAADLRRFMNDMPPVVKPAGLLTRVRKFAKRRPAVTVGFLTGIAALAATGLWLRADAERKRQEGLFKQSEVQATESYIASEVSEGELKLSRREWQAAQVHFENVLRVDSDRVEALGNLARVLMFQYETQHPPDPALLDRALKAGEKAYKLKPETRHVRNTYGTLLTDAKRYDEAIVVLSEEVQADPRSPVLHMNVGAVEFLRGALNEAEARLLEAVKYVDEPQPRYCYPWRELATVQLLLRKDEALASIEKGGKCFVGRTPPEGVAWFHLVKARILLTLPAADADSGGTDAQPGDSADHARKAAEQALYDAQVADGYAGQKEGRIKRYLALACLRNQRWKDARREARAALELHDLPCYDWLILSVAEAHSGEVKAASEAYWKADLEWPGDLRAAGAFQTSRTEGRLWFECAHELLALRAEAEKLLP